MIDGGRVLQAGAPDEIVRRPADHLTGDAAFSCRLPDRPESAQVAVTVLDPPYSGADGTLLVPGARIHVR